MIQPLFEDAIETQDVMTFCIGVTDHTGEYPAPASKLFKKDGGKKSRQPSFLLAVQIYVPDAAELARLLSTAQSHSTFALCNGRFPGRSVYSFEDVFTATEGRLTISALRQRVMQIGFIIAPDKWVASHPKTKAIARTNANTLPTSWLFLDNDVEPHTPERFATASLSEWLGLLSLHMPGLDQAPRVETQSSSARVFRDGKPLGAGRGHCFVKMCSVERLDQVRNALKDSLIVAGDAWAVPNKNGGCNVRFPVDFAVWTSVAMSYAGRPEVETDSGLVVQPAQVVVANDTGAPVDLSLIPVPDEEQLRAAHQALSPDTQITTRKGGQIDIYDLDKDQEVELESGQMTTVVDLRDELIARRLGGELKPKIRIQSPFREESRSIAAYAGLGVNSDIFVVDSGLPGETHWLRRDPLEDFGSPPEGNRKPATEQPVEVERYPAFPEPFPGVMSDMVAAILAVAKKPQPELAMLAVLVGMASGCPGVYRLPDDMRLNLYGCGIAQTGDGKELPRVAAAELAYLAGAQVIGQPGSGEGLEDALPSDVGLLSQIDEVGFLLAAVNGSRASAHHISLAGNMLRLFSASSSKYQTRTLAKRKDQTTRTLLHPCFNVIGFSTPEKLGKSLNDGNVSDGLLGRFLIAPGRSRIDSRRPKGRLVIPESVKAQAERIRKGSDLLPLLDEQERTITISTEADTTLDSLMRLFSRKGDNASEQYARALFARSFEKAMRICGVLAVWDNPEHPEVTVAHVRWAEQFVEACDQTAVIFCSQFMHAGRAQADAARITKSMQWVMDKAEQKLTPQAVRARKHGCVLRSEVLKHSKLDAIPFARGLEHLEALGEVESVSVQWEDARGRGREVKLLRRV